MRGSLIGVGVAVIAAVTGLFVLFWILIEVWIAFGFLAVAAILLLLAWLYDRREKRGRPDLPPV